MQFVVKFTGVAAIAIFFASCHNDVPSLPTSRQVEDYAYCKYIAKVIEDGVSKDICKCKSTYEISRESCEGDVVKGTIYTEKEDCDEACKVP